MENSLNVERHRRLLAVYLRSKLAAAIREELGAWLDRDWQSLTLEEQQAVDDQGSDDVVGIIDLPTGLGDGAPPRCVVQPV